MQKGALGYANMSNAQLQGLLGADLLRDHKFGTVQVLFVIYKTVAGKETDDKIVHVLPEDHGAEYELEAFGQTLKIRVTQTGEDLIGGGLPAGLAVCNGEVLFADKSVEVIDDLAVARAVPLIPPLPRRKPQVVTVEGKDHTVVCGDCILFDRKVGKDELLKVTHHYENGVMMMNREIVQCMAELYGRPTLNERNVGHCPKQEELCAETTPACEEYELLTAEEEKAQKAAETNSQIAALKQRIAKLEGGNGQA